MGIGIIGNLCNPVQAPLACKEDESHSKQDLLSDKLVYSQPQPCQTNEINVAYKTLLAKATTGNKAFPLGSVDSWIEELNPSGDTRVFMCSQTDVTLITKLAATQSLPQIEIPTFDGSALDWLNFIVQFKEVIHDQAHLSGSQRMIYLLQVLIGEAKQAIAGLSHDWCGYVSALKRLKLLFGQKAYIVNAYIANILQHPRIEDSDTKKLSTFYYNLSDCVTALLRLDFTSDILSSTLLGRVLQKLPSRLRTKWSEHAWRLRSTEEPTMLHLQTWLQDRVMANSIYNNSNFQIDNKQVSKDVPDETSNVKSSNGPCKICKNTHRLNKCRHYINKSPKDRLAVVKTNNLCTNCLREGHDTQSCSSKLSCLVGDCSERHHTTLHDSLTESGYDE